MSLIRNGYAVSTRRGVLGVLFSALLALALFDAGAASAQEGKQIKLTEKHIQGFMAAYKDMAKLYESANPDKPDPNVDAATLDPTHPKQISVPASGRPSPS